MSESGTFAKEAIKDVTGQPATGGRPHQAGDYSFNNIGISSFFMLLSSMPEQVSAEKGYYSVGGCGGNIEWHTEADTIEIADRDVLLRDIKVYISTLSRVANADVFPFDFRDVADEFSRTLAAYAMAAGERFDFSPAVAELAVFKLALDRFYAAASQAASAGDKAAWARCNDAILRLARILVPINFGREGRFRHDPAAPIRELPDLAPALRLARLAPESDLAHFTVAHLVRGQNRLVDALRQATREVRLAVQA
jgi:N-acetylated-alpha-linked acidic dipeptidase